MLAESSPIMVLPEGHKPVVTMLPPLPSSDFLDQAQWDTLFAMLDGFFPSIGSASAADADESTQILMKDADFAGLLDQTSQSMVTLSNREALVSYFSHRPADQQAFRESCVRTLASSHGLDGLRKALDTLG